MSITVRPDPTAGYWVRIRYGVPPIWFASRSAVAIYLSDTKIWECAQP